MFGSWEANGAWGNASGRYDGYWLFQLNPVPQHVPGPETPIPTPKTEAVAKPKLKTIAKPKPKSKSKTVSKSKAKTAAKKVVKSKRR